MYACSGKLVTEYEYFVEYGVRCRVLLTRRKRREVRSNQGEKDTDSCIVLPTRCLQVRLLGAGLGAHRMDPHIIEDRITFSWSVSGTAIRTLSLATCICFLGRLASVLASYLFALQMFV